MRFSIIIANYNYEKYLRQSIDSALAIDWRDKEVIVVDDGSTDESRTIIASYGDKITAICQPNGGQCTAINAGFAASTGDVVISHDADDLIDSNICNVVAGVWNARVSAIQWGLRAIDADGAVLDADPTPNFTERDTPQSVMARYKRTGFYVMSPGGAIAWSRRFLKLILPLPPLKFFDDYLSLLAPFFGEVVSLPGSFGSYRRHLASDSVAADAAHFSVAAVEKVYRHDIEVFQEVNLTLQRLHGKTLKQFGINMLKDNGVMANVLLLHRFADFQSRFTLLKYVRSVLLANRTVSRKAALIGWGFAIAVGPRKIALRAADVRAAKRSLVVTK